MKKHGFNLIEIMITVVVVAVVAIPLMMVMTSSRKDTAHAINYLRAVELGNEVIDLVHSLKYEKITKDYLNNFLGESVTDPSDVLKTVKLKTRDESINKSWNDNGFLATDLSYPVQYAQFYFFRTIEVEPDEKDKIDYGFKKVTVKVSWAEVDALKGIKVNDVTSDTKGERNKYIVLSTVIPRDRDFTLNNGL